MSAQKHDDHHKLGSQFGVNLLLMTISIVVFIFIYFMIYLMFADISETIDKNKTIISLVIWLIFIIIGLTTCYIDLDKFKSALLFDPIFGTTRAVFEGFHFKLPWEEIEHEVSLKTELEEKFEETVPTKDGSVTYKATLMIKANCGSQNDPDKYRTKLLIRYCSHDESAIKEQVFSLFKNVVREEINAVSTSTAVKLKSKLIDGQCDFKELEEKLAIEVVKHQVNDIDYTAETQRMRNSLFGGRTLVELTKLLQDEGGYSQEEAKALAPLMSEHVKLDKKIQEFKISGIELPEELLESITNFFKSKSK